MELTELVEILVCPICHANVELLEQNGATGFLCPKCSLVYPVTDGIPVMLPAAAIPVAEWPKEEK